MINISLFNTPNILPNKSISHAAKICYTSDIFDILEKDIDIKNVLFETGHHTTLQHSFFTFLIDNIAISNITFGLHLCHPFYNTDQRSGRYASKIFVNYDLNKIKDYIYFFWKIDDKILLEILDFIKFGLDIYHANIDKAIQLVIKNIKKERPNITDEYIAKNAKKIAQEQLRMFISTIFPTALDFTINLSTLVAIYHSSFDVAQKYITSQMAKLVLSYLKSNDIDFSYMFDDKYSISNNLDICVLSTNCDIKYKPNIKLLSIKNIDKFKLPKNEQKFPIDMLYFSPDMMSNTQGFIETEIEVSVATMGQDQRHRTIKRSLPTFTGNFYIPPIVSNLNLENQAADIMNKWFSLKDKIPNSLFYSIVPYGAMVKYTKLYDFNALIHEQSKRLCFCAQEEIYHLSLFLREEVLKQYKKYSDFIKIFEPPCYSYRCIEGNRYCGRDLSKKSDENLFFVERFI